MMSEVSSDEQLNEVVGNVRIPMISLRPIARYTPKDHSISQFEEKSPNLHEVCDIPLTPTFHCTVELVSVLF